MHNFMGMVFTFAVASAARLSNEDLLNFYGRSSISDRPLSVVMNASQTLREAAAARNPPIFVGSAINLGCLTNASEPQYSSTAMAQFSLTTAENECKWGSTEQTENVFTLAACQQLENFTRSTGGAFRNHNLAWGVYNPDWLVNGKFSGPQLKSLLIGHITAMAKQFGDSSYAFDVVNEAVSDNGNPNVILKNNTWYPALPDYIDVAFTTARALMPKAKLFYNDYAGEGLSSKSDKIYNLVSGMLDRGIPIDGVGLQMHVSVDAFPAFADVTANIQRLAALNLDVHVTEMDVRCEPDAQGNICNTTRLNAQAKIYGGMLKACLSSPRCKSFETWGFTDRHTWLSSFDNPSHKNVQPLPWDKDYNLKPAFYEILAELQQP